MSRTSVCGLALAMGLGSTSALAGPSAADEDTKGAAPPTNPSTAPVAIGWLLLDSEGLDDAALRDHLRLRLPATALRTPGDPQPPLSDTQIAGLVRARRSGADVELTLTFTDGRTYDRTVLDPGPAPERTVASELSSLARAALEGRVDPDRMSETDFVAADEATEQDSADDDEADTATTDPSDPSESEAVSPAPPSPDFGLRVAGFGTFGIAPATDIARGSFGGGELGLDIAWPSGAVLSLALSGSGRARPLPAQRLRGGVGAGYRWQRGAFEWLNVGRVEIEAWFFDDDRPLFEDGREVDGRPPLLGVTLVSSPGWYHEGPLPFRVGPRVELGLRGALGDPQGAPRLFDGAAPADPALLRLGGLELGLGVEMQLWFGRPKRRDERPVNAKRRD